jgi:hypothetical protein
MMVQALSIRTKLIMAMLAMVASVALMGMTADDAHAGVTEIRNIYNYTGKTVYVWNHESGRRITIADRRNEVFNQWVPWCVDSTEYDKNKYIEVGYIENGNLVHKYSIWQQDKGGQDRIRYFDQRSYSTYAQPMPGASQVGGRRNLYLWNLDVPALTDSSGVRLFNTS